MKRAASQTIEVGENKELRKNAQTEMADLDHHFDTNTIHPIIPRVQEGAWINGFENYKALYDRSINDPNGFWDEKAKELISWFQPFSHVQSGGFKNGDIAWFLNGKLNVCYNCVDRHALKNPNKNAILYEGDEVTHTQKITYGELLQLVCKMSNLLLSLGVKKGDTVCIYLPMAPMAVVSMLACARIGAIHNVVFAGFSAVALASRIQDANCSVVLTADESIRGGRSVPLKLYTDEALKDCPSVKHVLVLKHTGSKIPFHDNRDLWLLEELEKHRPYCPPVWMDSEDPLFMLYTSGSTGKPKALVHTQAGYLLYTTMTHRYIFDFHENDVYACVADVGWITGHSYIVYGPLSNGGSTFLFESMPLYPDAGRYWDMVQRYKITQFYTAPTAIRALMKFGTDPIRKYDLSSLKILGSVGEPINPAAWQWYFEEVGQKRCAIVDTYWQTETGGIMMTPLPGATPMKPGACAYPFFGVKPVLLSDQGEVTGNSVKGVLAFAHPWPSVARTVYNNHQRYLQTYMDVYPGYFFTGDGAYRDQDGCYWIYGRIDDVISVSGHRLGTAEIENSLVASPACSEAAAVAVPHEVKGQSVVCFCTLKEHYNSTPDLIQELRIAVRHGVSPIATPDHIYIVPGLPKTRSGKIMRRLLARIARGDHAELGDISTLADPGVIQEIIKIVHPPK